LYLPGGYEKVIVSINTWITSGVPTTDLARFYRACAFGQLYESYCTAPLPAAAPYVSVLPPEDAAAIEAIVRQDLLITNICAGDAGRTQMLSVINPTPTAPEDNDLQILAADQPSIVPTGLTVMPAAPSPNQKHPPKPVIIPDPTIAGAGTLAKWILTCSS
jgi:hypothetical protein